MKTIITIENGKITVQVDDGEPVVTAQPTPIKTPYAGDKDDNGVPTAPPLDDFSREKPKPGGVTITSPSGNRNLGPELCFYCKRRGSPCVRHGGTPAAHKTKGAVNTKDCAVCGKSLAGYHVLAKVCSEDCRAEKARRYVKAYSANGQRPPKSDEPKADYCKHCQAFTTHDTAHHPEAGVVSPPPAPLIKEPDFLPGYEKSEEELESWKPQVIGAPDSERIPNTQRASGDTAGAPVTDPDEVASAIKRVQDMPKGKPGLFS